MMLPIAIEAAGPAPDAFAERAWGGFSRSPALAGERVSVDMALDGRTGNQPEYKFRLTRRSPGAPDQQLWADSRACPAVRVVLGRLRELTPPPIVPLGFKPESQEIMVDGIGYSLTAPLADSVGQAKITWTSNMGTPRAAWVEDSLTRLKLCWSLTPSGLPANAARSPGRNKGDNP